MAQASDDPPREDAGELALSLVRGDASLRLQRAIGLVPRQGLGVGRRAVFFAALTWLPIAVWALLAGRVVPGAAPEPLLQHFGVHVRCLVAIPLFVVAEGVAHGVSTRLLPYFLRSGLVTDRERPRFEEILRRSARLRDSTLPWVVVLGAIVAWQIAGPDPHESHELVWAQEGAGFGFGGFWFVYVTRPVFVALLAAWLWRLILLGMLSLRISRLDLALVPTHADGAGGLGFLESFPTVFSPVILGLSAVLASRWAHDVLYHGVHVDTLRLPMIVFGATALVLFLLPFLPWVRLLAAARRRALLEYGALVGRHGRLVRRRWIEGEALPDEPLLDAPEIGPVADTLALYEAVRKLRVVPIGRRALAAIALPAALPMLPVLAIEIPVREMLLKILSTLA